MVLIISVPMTVMGQLRSRYNLNRIEIGLMDGKTLNGKCISASRDTLFMEGAIVADAKGLVPGSEISFRMKGAGRDYSGMIEEAADESFQVRLFDQPDTTYAINRRYVTYLEITRPAPGYLAKLGVPLPASQIRYIRVHSRGAGAVGFLVGLIVGVSISTAIVADDVVLFNEPPPGYIAPVIIAPILGVVIATSGKNIG